MPKMVELKCSESPPYLAPDQFETLCEVRQMLEEHGIGDALLKAYSKLYTALTDANATLSTAFMKMDVEPDQILDASQQIQDAINSFMDNMLRLIHEDIRLCRYRGDRDCITILIRNIKDITRLKLAYVTSENKYVVIYRVDVKKEQG